MNIQRHASKAQLGAAAARQGDAAIAARLAETGHANVVLATGASQFEMLDALVAADIDWPRLTVFHLDEYVALPRAHPASFRRYLEDRFLSRLPQPTEFIAINGEAADLDAELARLGALLRGHPIDVCFAGIGENGHLAFNDPPADFETDEPYLIVSLDEACRRQQLGEGWFPDLAAVPRRAISMSIRQIMKSRTIILSVPDARKARAVQQAVEGPVTPLVPASILQRHPDVTLHLDEASASGLAS